VVSWLETLEGRALDLQIVLRSVIEPQGKPPLALLMVDEKTIREVGSLPIDRRIMTRVVDRLRDEGARWIVFDMLFSEASRLDAEADRLLAQAIKNAGNVLLPYSLGESGRRNGTTQAKTEPNSPPLPDYVLKHSYLRYSNDSAAQHIPLRPDNLLAPITILGDAAFATGHVSAKTGPDGSLRYDQPILYYDDEFLPSLAMLTATLAAGAEWRKTEAVLGRWIDFPGYRTPIDAFSRQLINYYGPSNTIPHYSLADFLAKRLPKGVFNGHTVVIGGTALGASDRNPSPFDAALPGPERLATVIDNILTQRVLLRPSWAAIAELTASAILPFIVVLLIASLRLNRALPSLLLLGVTLLIIVQWLFVRHLQVVAFVFPLLALLMSGGLSIALRAWSDERLRRRAEVRLRLSEERYRLTAQGANDGLWDWDIQNNEVFYSERWRQLMGRDADEPIVGIEGWYELLDQVEAKRLEQQMKSHLSGHIQQLYHVMSIAVSGQTRWLLARGVAVKKNDEPVRVAGSLTDITEQKQLEKQISFDALHDSLTGLANRDLFNDRLRHLIMRSGDVTNVGMLLVDLNKFRIINQKYNQAVGNDLLSEVALRLDAFTGDDSMLLARFGPDQFVLAYADEDIADHAATPGATADADEEASAWNNTLVAQAERVRQIFKEPFILSGEENQVTVTIAAAHTAQGLESSDDLMNATTLALANAKHSDEEKGKHIGVFNPADREAERSRRWLSQNIDLSLAAGDQFQLYYMPFIRLADQRLIGFEALIRWHHPVKHLINPGEFIPFAEESGQINEIGRWSLYQGVKDLLAWEDMGFDGEIAINISARQFADMDLPGECRKMLKMLGQVPPSRVKLEVTESMAMSNPQRVTNVLQEITDMGFHISIDDFGTGYSSLAYLHRFPFHTLKVDQSFVRGLSGGEEISEIVRTIAGLGKALDKQVLAEGVETEEQAKVLLNLGVQIGQGWLFSKAIPVPEATQYIQKMQAGQEART